MAKIEQCTCAGCVETALLGEYADCAMCGETRAAGFIDFETELCVDCTCSLDDQSGEQ